MTNSEYFGKQTVGRYHIAYREGRKGIVVCFASVGVIVQRPGSAIVRTEDIGAYHIPFVGVEECAAFNRMRPPIGHIAVGGESVAYPYHIVAGFVESAVTMIGYIKFGKYHPRFQPERVMTTYDDRFS